MAKTKSKLFEFVDAVSHTKDASFMDDPTWEKEYVPFIVNRAFSYHRDSVLAANVMNERPHLQKNLQAWFYLNTLRARKRYASWHKREQGSGAKSIAEYYGCSLRIASVLVNLHTPEQIEYIERRLFKGGC
jgi:hypothetical protein